MRVGLGKCWFHIWALLDVKVEYPLEKATRKLPVEAQR